MSHCRITTFCCFDNTKSGSICNGFYSTVTAVLIVFENVIFLSRLDKRKYKKDEYTLVEENIAHVEGDDYEDTILKEIPRGGRAFIWISLIVNSSVAVAGLLLVYAVTRSHRRYMVPWMMLMGLRILINGFFTVAVFLFTLLIPMLFVIFIPVALFMMFEFYTFICVYSQYKLLGENLPEYVEWSKATAEETSEV